MRTIPKGQERRSVRIELLLTPTEFREWSAGAAAIGVDMSNFIRLFIRQKLNKAKRDDAANAVTPDVTSTGNPGTTEALKEN